MRGYVVRIGVDQAYGQGNAPMDPRTNEFMYVPIPEGRAMSPELSTPYVLIQDSLARFRERHQEPAPRKTCRESGDRR